MSQAINFKIAGLFTYPSDISGVPPGSLTRALNIDLAKPNLAQYRRGYNLLDYSLPDPANRANRLFLYSSNLFAIYDNTLGRYQAGVGWSSKGAITKPANALVARQIAANQNLYVASSTGLKKLDSLSGVLYDAGIPKGLHLTLALGSAGTAVENNKSVAYRYCLVRNDANNNPVKGGVSSAGVISNATGGTKDVAVTAYLPAGVDTTYSIQVYRTINTSGTPNDELQLCYQTSITSTDTANGYVLFTDLYPDSLLGAALYTNPSQEGISQDNEMPPVAADIELHKGYLFFADVEGKQRFQLTLVSVYDGAAGQLRTNDTLTISDGTTTEIYTAKVAESVGSKQFACDQISASLSVRIDSTIRSLINVINRGSTLLYATLISSGSALPGQISLVRRSAGAAFTLVSSRASSWNPNLAAVATISQTSQNDAFRNGLMWSKAGLSESVPIGNVLRVGSSDDPIVRIKSSHDCLLIFKARDGAFVLRGSSPANWDLTELDATCKIVAPESIVQVNSLVYGLFENGISEVSDTAVSIVSEGIADRFQELYGADISVVRTTAFAVSYEVDSKYILCLPSSSLDTYSTQQVVLNVQSGAISEWDLRVSAGVVNGADTKLYWAAGDSSKIKIESKTFTYQDFQDFEQELTLDSQAGTFLTFVSGVEFMSIGDVIEQDGLSPSYVLGVDVNTQTIEVDLDQTWDPLYLINHYRAIEAVIEWNPEYAGNPAGFKHFVEASFVFKTSIIRNAVIAFTSDLGSVREFEVTGANYVGAWGLGAWGAFPWGGGLSGAPLRVGVPPAVARCNRLTVRLTHRIARSPWQLEGLSLVFNPISTRVSR